MMAVMTSSGDSSADGLTGRHFAATSPEAEFDHMSPMLYSSSSLPLASMLASFSASKIVGSSRDVDPLIRGNNIPVDMDENDEAVDIIVKKRASRGQRVEAAMAILAPFAVGRMSKREEARAELSYFGYRRIRKRRHGTKHWDFDLNYDLAFGISHPKEVYICMHVVIRQRM